MKKFLLIALIAAVSLLGGSGFIAQGDHSDFHYGAEKYNAQEEHPDPN